MKSSKLIEWPDEEWKVVKIPNTARLYVKVYRIDDRTHDEKLLGEFTINNLVDYRSPEKGHRIRGKNNQTFGHFRLSSEAKLSLNESVDLPDYTFDGPPRYTRHYSISSPFSQNPKLELILKVNLKRTSSFFQRDSSQNLKTNHLIKRTMFNGNQVSFSTQNAAKLAHDRLNPLKTRQDENGFIKTNEELWRAFFTDPSTKKIRPAIYIYVLDNHTWRFTETDGESFSNFAKKCSLLANGCQYVRLSGEFHLRPKYGWKNTHSQWEIVFDNGGGPNAPDTSLLLSLKKLLLFNFPGLNVATYSADDPVLQESRQKTKEAMETSRRYSIQTNLRQSTFS